MGWLTLLAGAIGLVREIVKLLSEKQQCKADRAKELKEMRLAIRRAREEKKTDDIQKMFHDLRLRGTDDPSV